MKSKIPTAKRSTWRSAARSPPSCNDKADLDSVPSDPEKLLGDLPKKYLVAVRATVTNVPDALRDQALGIYDMMSEMANAAETKANRTKQFAIRTKVMQRGMEQITMLVKETDQIVLGLNIDRSTNKTYLDLEIDRQGRLEIGRGTLAGEAGQDQFRRLPICPAPPWSSTRSAR